MHARLIPALMVLVTLVLVIAFGSPLWSSQSSRAQSDDESMWKDVIDLQTRVAALETQVAGSNPTPSINGQHTIMGVFETGCDGFIKPGEILTLKDETGKIIGSTSLGPYLPEPGATYDCAMKFTMTDVPDAQFYTFQWANFTVGTYPFSHLDSMNWNIVIAFV